MEAIFSKTRSATKAMLKVLRLNKLPYLGERSDATSAYRAAPRRRLLAGTLALWQRAVKGDLKSAESGLLALL
jgi:hypothetical protein